MKIKSYDFEIAAVMAGFKFLSMQLIYFIVSFLEFTDYDIQLLYLTLLVNAIVIVLCLKFNNQSEKIMLKRYVLSKVFSLGINIVFWLSGIESFYLHMSNSHLLENNIITSSAIVYTLSTVFFIAFPLVFMLLHAVYRKINLKEKLGNLNLANLKMLKNNSLTSLIVGIIVLVSTSLMIYFATFDEINFLIPVVILITALCSFLMIKNCKEIEDSVKKTGVLYLFYIAQVGLILTNINP
ncbi:MAG: hypothetical protein R3Y27_01880 [Clostridia bacterium]